jgi:hypothetical protein
MCREVLNCFWAFFCVKRNVDFSHRCVNHSFCGQVINECLLILLLSLCSLNVLIKHITTCFLCSLIHWHSSCKHIKTIFPEWATEESWV